MHSTNLKDTKMICKTLNTAGKEKNRDLLFQNYVLKYVHIL